MKIIMLIVSVVSTILANDITGIYLDKKNKIMWEDNKPFSRITYADAEKHCQTLTLGGYKNWEIPTQNEIQTIKKVNDDFAYNAKGPYDLYFWTSTKKVRKYNGLVFISYQSYYPEINDFTTQDPSNKYFLRCMRKVK